MLGLLLLGAALGLGMDVMLYLAYRAEQVRRGGDGLGMYFPFMGALLLAPVQIGAAIAWWSTFQTRRRRIAVVDSAALQPLASSVNPALRDLDEGIFERDKARSTRRTALWLLGVPVASALLAELAGLFGVTFDTLPLLAGPCWALGFVYGAVSLGRYGDWIPLAFALLYPVTGVILSNL